MGRLCCPKSLVPVGGSLALRCPKSLVPVGRLCCPKSLVPWAGFVALSPLCPWAGFVALSPLCPWRNRWRACSILRRIREVQIFDSVRLTIADLISVLRCA